MHNITGCNLCYADIASDAWALFKKTDIIESLIDESHFSIRARQCKQCQQHYLSVFTERIDWDGGEDPQLWSIIPISTEELTYLKQTNSEQVLVKSIRKFASGRKSLCADWPKGSPQRVFWLKGVLIGEHD